ncbi:hypothetical protein [Sphingopyxis macrogoltabida]|uniref:Uncharacterized protein n=1 Tax=Sphingopyxis macrogoltabida TaxID=33050 RepID=A0A0N9V504_SPHMC|nr:hypothetical protein [Sphingopyxis macrogoltabida]ALH82960.1 hypothetical protein AN936_22170 [Sphingopyxis macrogoltabida]
MFRLTLTSGAAIAASLFLCSPLLAQTGATPAKVEGLPATEWEAAYAKPLDDAAVAAPEIFRLLTEWAPVKDPKNPGLYRKYIGEDEAKLVIRHLRRDGKLDAGEIDLLEEFAFPKDRVIQLTRLGTDGKPDKPSKTAVTTPPGMMQSFARELVAMWQSEWERPDATGWPTLAGIYARDPKQAELLHKRVRAAGCGAPKRAGSCARIRNIARCSGYSRRSPTCSPL